jgi:Prokaryotic E2 family E
MTLLLDTDYEEIKACGLEYIENEPNRFLILTNYQLVGGLYQQKSCDILVVVPQRYNQDGNDMFWTYPRLVRTDNKQIPATNEPGGGDNRIFNGKEFCRWSRHWQSGSSVWKPGKDNIVTILRRIAWALGNPDTQ